MCDKQICNYDDNELMFLRSADRITIILYITCSNIAGFELLLKSHFAIISRAKWGLQPAAGENFLRIAKQFLHFAMWIFEHCDVVFFSLFCFLQSILCFYVTNSYTTK